MKSQEDLQSIRHFPQVLVPTYHHNIREQELRGHHSIPNKPKVLFLLVVKTKYLFLPPDNQ
jgi:hypothetical protein